MKKIYLLSFSDGLGTMESVKKYLNAIPEIKHWRYDMTNAFYIVSESSAETLFEKIHAQNGTGKFIIVEIGENRQGWITADSWYLIQNKAHKPAT
ncbi:MAG: hypothetical protein HY552_01510 [Elusimicrobia bacterium]|nr:hypothetical protein [Elusimicrobiota bacterium]